MLVVSGVAGVQRMTKEHLAIALALQVNAAGQYGDRCLTKRPLVSECGRTRYVDSATTTVATHAYRQCADLCRECFPRRDSLQNANAICHR